MHLISTWGWWAIRLPLLGYITTNRGQPGLRRQHIIKTLHFFGCLLWYITETSSIVLNLKTSAVRSGISSTLIFASCGGYSIARAMGFMWYHQGCSSSLGGTIRKIAGLCSTKIETLQGNGPTWQHAGRASHVMSMRESSMVCDAFEVLTSQVWSPVLQSKNDSTALFHRCRVIMFLPFRKTFTKVGNVF